MKVKKYSKDIVDDKYIPTWKRKLTQHIQDLNKDEKKEEKLLVGRTNPPIEDF